MEKRLFTVLLSSIVICANAQFVLRHQSVDWENDIQLHTFEKEELQNESAVVIKDDRYIELTSYNKEPCTYHTTHKIIRVNDDVGIEKYNEVYIPIHNGALVNLKVRTIDNNNTVHQFNEENLKELKNVDGYGDYKIFAVEGLVKGGELEYLYTIRKPVRLYGREIYQTDFPVLNARFEIHFPYRYNYSTKSYNGFPQDLVEKNKKTIVAKNIPPLPKEASSSYTSKLMRVDYKLEKTTSKPSFLSWSNISRSLLRSVHSKKGEGNAKKFLKSLNVDSKTEKEQIIAIEEEFKTHFTIKDGKNEDYSDINLVFKNKVGNQTGIARAYLKCFELLDMQVEIVFTGSRFLGEIDKEYSHYMGLEDILFYFPKHDKYLSPEYNYIRFGTAPSTIAGNDTLFIIPVYKSGYPYQKHRIRTIAHLSAAENKTETTTKITIDKTLQKVFVEERKSIQGYDAFYHNALYRENKQSLKENVLTKTIEDAAYTSLILDQNLSNLANESEINLDYSYTSHALLQKIGDEAFFFIGKTIGEEHEISKKEDRVTDIIFDFPKSHHRTITVLIPEGYTLKGTEKLKTAYTLQKNNGEIAMKFTTDYTQQEDKLIINLVQDNYLLELNKKYYSKYKELINTINNLTKTTLILSPIPNK